ncbi:MAG: NAD-dependent deacylase [Betaproteobacteria bacterium]|nr:NAD-dependent deacylase [Betaproteobacteria bacterium]
MDHDSLPGAIAQARDLLEHATSVAVLTGAGISAESGIPTFRDAMTGLWTKFRPEDLAMPEAFASNPERVWRWYAERRLAVSRALPNAGHHALFALEERLRGRDIDFTLVTQNVDGLHHEAGSRNVVELHGNIRRVKCFDRHHAVDAWEDGDAVPACPRCGSLLRPDVVWFGEMLPRDGLARAFAAAHSCDVFLCVGTSALVDPAASLPFIALEAGARVIEVNPQPSLAHDAILRLEGAAGELLPRLIGGETGA